MASSYTPQTQVRTVKVLGPAQVVPVERVGATTLPHNVYFEVDVPLTTWAQDAGATLLGELATAIEQRLSSGLADSAAFVQDVDENGLLTDAVEFLVSIEPPVGTAGPMTTTVVVPVNLLTADPAFVGDLVTPMFEAALDRLRATAAL